MDAATPFEGEDPSIEVTITVTGRLDDPKFCEILAAISDISVAEPVSDDLPIPPDIQSKMLAYLGPEQFEIARQRAAAAMHSLGAGWRRHGKFGGPPPEPRTGRAG